MDTGRHEAADRENASARNKSTFSPRVPGRRLKRGTELRLHPGTRKRRRALRRAHKTSDQSSGNRLAMVSVLATLIVAVMGTITTLTVATMNAKTSDQQADEDFRRNNQRVAYAEYESQMVDISHSINGLVGRMKVPPQYLPSQQDMTASLSTINESVRKVNDKYSVVMIVASDETLTLAKDWLTKCVEAMGMIATAITVQDTAFGVDRAKVDSASAKMMDAAAVSTKFLESARHDVNAFG
jgi:hypothetical protein